MSKAKKSDADMRLKKTIRPLFGLSRVDRTSAMNKLPFSDTASQLSNLQVKQLKALQMSYKNKLKEMKHKINSSNETKNREIKVLATIESVAFIKNWSVKIMSAVTKEYHSLLHQFIDFRVRTWGVIDDLKDYGDRMKQAELVSAM